MKGIAAFFTCLLLSGCANVPLERDKVAKISNVDVLVVESPGIQVMSVMQALANSPQAGAIPILIAEGQDKVYVRPPAIPDFAGLIAQGLRERLPQEKPWWPKMSAASTVVPLEHKHPREALRVHVQRYEIAPPPLRFVFAVVEVSLRDASGQPLWSQRKTFSGGIDGERVDMDKLEGGDASQLAVEVRRAAAYLVNALAESLP